MQQVLQRSEIFHVDPLNLKLWFVLSHHLSKSTRKLNIPGIVIPGLKVQLKLYRDKFETCDLEPVSTRRAWSD